MMKLENLVTELVQIKNTELQGNETNPIENILQLVGKELITKCQIIIGNIVIEPLWLEAYYYNACMGFMEGTKGYYSHAPLAMVAVDVFKNKPQYEVVKNSLEKNFKKEWILAKYALENGESTPEEIRGFLKNEGLCSYNIGLKSIEGEIGENGEVKSVGARKYVNKWK